MIKLLGCTCVATAAACLGFRAAARLKGQLRALDELITGLELLEQELEFHAPELEVLMRNLSGRTRGAAKRLFSSFAEMLKRGDGAGPGNWERCVSETEDIIPEGKACLYGLGEVLGRYDCREQRECVAAVRRRLESVRETERAQCQNRCRTCQTVGLFGGAFLIILLL